MKRKIFSALTALLLLTFSSCYEDEKLNVPVTQHAYSDDEIDQYIQANFQDEYGITVRYKFVDNFVEAGKRVTPPKRDLVVPMLNFLEDFWVEPFVQVENGEAFFREHVPAEMVFIGSLIYNGDGTVTLGTADAGARITLTEVNAIDVENQAWIFRQLGTIYHEFAHIMHQRYNLPPNFEQISPQGYTSAGSWYNLTDEEALERGFVSPYGTSSYNEDFAEVVAHILYTPNFYELYINDEPDCVTADCVARNEGRAKIRKKYNAILNHYLQNTGVDLLKVREIVQSKY